MAVPQFQRVVRRLGTLLDPERQGKLDADLLCAFRRNRDPEAFAELLRRHGKPVMTVCRRVLGDQPAADDAWQATFLILARRAAGLSTIGSLASWLHGVAYRTALNERRASLRRRAHETHARPPVVVTPDRQAAWNELQELVDSEVERLPTHLREVFVRCCLGDECRSDVAKRLGLNEGTVRGRLMAARRLMGDRLARKGISLSTALVLLAATSSRVSAHLSSVTIEAASHIVRSLEVPGHLVSRQVVALSHGVGRTSGLSQLIAATFLVVAGFVGIGLGIAQPPTNDAPPKKEPPATATTQVEKTQPDPLPAGAIARLGTTRFRTGNMVGSLVFSPDGKRIASWGNALYKHDQFSLWDAQTGKQSQSYRTEERSLLTLAWPAPGKGFAVLKSGVLWDFTADPPIALPAQGPGGPPRVPVGGNLMYEAATLSADGKNLAVLSSNGHPLRTLEIYEFKSAKAIGDLKLRTTCVAAPAVCKSLAFTPNGKRLIGACNVMKDQKPTEAGMLVVWSTEGKIERTIDLPKGSLQWGDCYFAVSDDSAAVGMDDGNSIVVSLDDGKTRLFTTAHRAKQKNRGSGVFALAFAANGKTLATGGSDGMVRVTGVATGKQVREFGPHLIWPEALAFGAKSTRLASAGQDGVIRIWDLTSGKEAVPTGGHFGTVGRTAISADGKTIATEGGDDTLHIWDGDTGIERRRIEAGGNVSNCQLTANGDQLIAVVGYWDDPHKALKVWDTSTGKEATPAGFPKTITASGFRFTPDRKALLTYHENKLTAWSWPEGAPIWKADMPKPAKNTGINQITSLSISPDGRQFVTVAQHYTFREEKGLKFGYADDGVVDLWETATGKRLGRLVDSEGSCYQPAVYAADGTVIHSGGGILPTAGPGGKAIPAPRQLCVIDPWTGRLVREFVASGRPDGLNGGHSIILSADGKALFRATDVGEVQVFEVATGKFRKAFPGHLDTILALDAPSADVRKVVSGSKDTTALLWNVGFGQTATALIAADDRAKLWEAMADPNAENAYAAMVKLAGDPATLVGLVGAKLKPSPPGPAVATFASIIKDLDSARFATREAAAKRLDPYGEGAIELVRAELGNAISEEVRGRLIKFLERASGQDIHLVQCRAIELLEHVGTAEAKAALGKLAAGGPSRQTADAAGAIKRLAIRR